MHYYYYYYYTSPLKKKERKILQMSNNPHTNQDNKKLHKSINNNTLLTLMSFQTCMASLHFSTSSNLRSVTKHVKSNSLWLHWQPLHQGWGTLILEGHSPAEFSSNPEKPWGKTPNCILKTLISWFRCVLLGLELKTAGTPALQDQRSPPLPYTVHLLYTPCLNVMHVLVKLETGNWGLRVYCVWRKKIHSLKWYEGK